MLCYAMSKPFNSLAFFVWGFFALFVGMRTRFYLFALCSVTPVTPFSLMFSMENLHFIFNISQQSTNGYTCTMAFILHFFFFIYGVWFDHLSRCSTMMAHVYYSSFVYVKVDHVYVSTFEVLLSFCSFQRMAFRFFFLFPFYHAMTYFFLL